MKEEVKFGLIGDTWTVRRCILDDTTSGQCNYSAQLIEVDQRLKYDRFCRVLAHELIHAITNSLGFMYRRDYPAEDLKMIMDHKDMDVMMGLFIEIYDKVKKEIK